MPIADRQFEIQFLDFGVEAFVFTFGSSPLKVLTAHPVLSGPFFRTAGRVVAADVILPPALANINPPNVPFGT